MNNSPLKVPTIQEIRNHNILGKIFIFKEDYVYDGYSDADNEKLLNTIFKSSNKNFYQVIANHDGINTLKITANANPTIQFGIHNGLSIFKDDENLFSRYEIISAFVDFMDINVLAFDKHSSKNHFENTNMFVDKNKLSSFKNAIENMTQHDNLYLAKDYKFIDRFDVNNNFLSKMATMKISNFYPKDFFYAKNMEDIMFMDVNSHPLAKIQDVHGYEMTVDRNDVDVPYCLEFYNKIIFILDMRPDFHDEKIQYLVHYIKNINDFNKLFKNLISDENNSYLCIMSKDDFFEKICYALDGMFIKEHLYTHRSAIEVGRIPPESIIDIIRKELYGKEPIKLAYIMPGYELAIKK